jgi:hypothetical protein
MCNSFLLGLWQTLTAWVTRLLKRYKRNRMSNLTSLPATRNWFSAVIEYEGRGRAEFLDPKGSVEGAVKARFDDHGNEFIEMEVDPATIQATPALRTGMLMELLSGHTIEDTKSITIPFGGKQNPCTKLEITTADGVFTCTGDIHYGINGAILRFHARESQYNATAAGTAVYWVLPLTNLICAFTRTFPELAQHPLRVTSHNNPVVAFLYKDKPAYIERLVDYGTREENLLAAREPQIVTAVMVGEAVGSHVDFDDVQVWLPLDLLPLLGVATGCEIGAPWIEIRDARGHLVKRIHIKLGIAPFAKGHVALRETIDNGGIGRLLTQAIQSPSFGQSTLRVAAKYLMRGGRYDTSLEDQLDQLYRGLEGLCKHYGFADIDLTDGLGSSERTQVEQVLEHAWQDLRKIASSASASGVVASAQNIGRIADRVKNANKKDKPFGISVAQLSSNQFGLPDAAIVDAHYHINPRADGRKTWSDVLSYYRGTVIHESYLGFGGTLYDVDDALTVRFHLHDLLLRMILKMVQYDGTYQPTVISMTTREEVDWVHTHGSAQLLGYS